MPDKYTLLLTDLVTPKDDFQFRFNGRDVGRTYAESTPVGPRWYWSIYVLGFRGPMPEGVIVKSLADDLEAAKAAFKANWERLLAAGSVSRDNGAMRSFRAIAALVESAAGTILLGVENAGSIWRRPVFYTPLLALS